jgi:hypothetical protein
MAIYVYQTATGSLLSWIPDSLTIAQAQAQCVASNGMSGLASASYLAAAGLTAVDGLPPLDSTHVWDSVNKTVDTVAAPYVSNTIPSYSFILLFSPTETAAIRASTDPNVQHWLFALSVAQQIDLNDPITQQGIAYLVSINLLTQANANLILSGQPSQ